MAPDAPFGKGWLLDALAGEVTLLAIGAAPPKVSLKALRVPVNRHVADRYLGRAKSAFYLIRPDAVIAARWLKASGRRIEAAAKALWEGSP